MVRADGAQLACLDSLIRADQPANVPLIELPVVREVALRDPGHVEPLVAIVVFLLDALEIREVVAHRPLEPGERIALHDEVRYAVPPTAPDEARNPRQRPEAPLLVEDGAL